MTHFIQTRGFVLGTALFALVSVGYARPAQASLNFPPALQAALQKRFPGTSFCVPLCNACHETTAGGPANYNPFGQNLFNSGLGIDAPALVEPALDALLMKNLDSDGDGMTDLAELMVGRAPGFAGDNTLLCPTDNAEYGCGARIASAPPPVDRLGLFSAGLVVIGMTFLRRWQRKPR